MIKNKIILGLLLSGLTTIVNTATLIEQLDTNKASLETANAQITKAWDDLTKAYTKISTDVVAKINSSLPALDSKITDLSKTIDTLNQVPKAALLVLGTAKSESCISDLEPTLKWVLDNPIKTIKSTLIDVRDGFASANEPLNPAYKKDASGGAMKDQAGNIIFQQEVYNKLSAAQRHFQNAIARITAVRKALSDLAAD